MFGSRAFIAVGVILALVILATLVSLSCFGGGGDKKEPAPQPTATPPGSGPAEQALARYVETTLGKPYFEDCSKADTQRDVGKICSIFRGERGNLRAFVLGGTFSEGTQWAILEEKGGQWSVIQTPPITRDTAGIPGIPWPLTTGVDLVVAGAAPCLNVREGPALNQKAVDCIRDGTTIRLASGPATGDGLHWWQVAGRSGWVAGEFLRYPDAAR